MKNNLQIIEMQILCLRKTMHSLIMAEGNLESEEIIKISRKLDEVLNRYHVMKIEYENY